MLTSFRLLALGAALAIGAASSIPVLAADKEQVIKDREALMKRQGGDLGAVRGFIEDKNDLAKATAGATDLIQTMQKIPDVFPPGTEGRKPDGKDDQKPEACSGWKDFLAQRTTEAAKCDAAV